MIANILTMTLKNIPPQIALQRKNSIKYTLYSIIPFHKPLKLGTLLYVRGDSWVYRLLYFECSIRS